MIDLISGSAETTEIIAALRLLLAAFMGGILGIERTRKLRPAGLRTYMLVCIGACTVMTIGLLLFERHGKAFDPARMAAQVVSGIGFIGAGTIMVTSKHRIKGLTTAAGLWAAAGLGIVIGCGFYLVAVSVIVVLLATMLLADKLELMLYRRLRRLNIALIVSSLDEIKHISSSMEARGVLLTSVEFTESLNNEVVALSCVARLKNKMPHDEVIRMLYSLDGIIFAERLDL